MKSYNVYVTVTSNKILGTYKDLIHSFKYVPFHSMTILWHIDIYDQIFSVVGDSVTKWYVKDTWLSVRVYWNT